MMNVLTFVVFLLSLKQIREIGKWIVSHGKWTFKVTGPMANLKKINSRSDIYMCIYA